MLALLLVIVLWWVSLPFAAATPPSDHPARADAAVKKGDYREAVVSYHRALRDAPGNTQILMALAKSYTNLRRFDQAMTYAKQIPANDRQHRHQALILMGRIELRRQHWQQAKQHFKQALAQKQTTSAYLGLAQALNRLGDKKGAEAVFKEHSKLTGLQGPRVD